MHDAVTADVMQEFLDDAFNFAERNDIAMTAYRSEDCDWYVEMKLRDAHGWFSTHVEVRKSKIPTEKRLSSAIAKARKERIVGYTKRDPCSQAQVAA